MKRRRRGLERVVVVFVLLLVASVTLYLTRKERVDLAYKVDPSELGISGAMGKLADALEMLQDIRFDDWIRTEKPGNLRHSETKGKLVDTILQAIIFEARIFLIIEPVMFLEGRNRKPRIVFECTDKMPMREYLEKMAIEFVERVREGKVIYPMNGENATKYVSQVKNYVETCVGNQKSQGYVRLVGEMEFSTEVPLCSYLVIILLNIRQSVLNDFPKVAGEPSIYKASNAEMKEAAILLETKRYSYNFGTLGEMCDCCSRIYRGIYAVRLFRTHCDNKICSTCLRSCMFLPGGKDVSSSECKHSLENTRKILQYPPSSSDKQKKKKKMK